MTFLVLRVILLMSIIVSGCKPTSFKGATNSGLSRSVAEKPAPDLSTDPTANPENKPGPKPGQGVDPKTGEVPSTGPILTVKDFDLGCNDLNTTVTFSGSEKNRYKSVLRGQICINSRNRLHLMFLVDYSGSMGKHFDNSAGVNREMEGNDRLNSQGSCGRLDAAKTVLAKINADLKALSGEKPTVMVSFIPFANKVVNDMQKSMVLSEFETTVLNAKHFCRYVAQDSDHAVNGESLTKNEMKNSGAITAETNYEAAFNGARTTLAQFSANYNEAEVYFITDGEPTAPTSPEVALTKAVVAGKALRDDTSIRNLTINGLYLGKEGTPVYQKAAGVLAQITGSDKRVRAAKSAAELAPEIGKFPQPKMNVDTNKYAEMANFKAGSYNQVQLGIRSLKQVTPTIWEYETQPFLLHGEVNKTTANIVNVHIFGEEGFDYKANYTINFAQTP